MDIPLTTFEGSLKQLDFANLGDGGRAALKVGFPLFGVNEATAVTPEAIDDLAQKVVGNSYKGTKDQWGDYSTGRSQSQVFRGALSAQAALFHHSARRVGR